VLARLGIPPSACIEIEDSRNGPLAASQAGIPVLITRSMYFQTDDFAEALFSVDELSGL
jgi:beta-phosphoglucomutase-like phosphatase (HAD superfamily)